MQRHLQGNTTPEKSFAIVDRDRRWYLNWLPLESIPMYSKPFRQISVDEMARCRRGSPFRIMSLVRVGMMSAGVAVGIYRYLLRVDVQGLAKHVPGFARTLSKPFVAYLS